MEEMKQNGMISRRNFLKVSAGTIAGAVVLGAGSSNVEAAEYTETFESVEAKINQETYVFTDSLGRKVVLPKNIETVIPTGMYAQSLLTTLCPEKLKSVVKEIENEDKDNYCQAGKEYVVELPDTGNMYGGEGRNIKTAKIDALNSEVIIDVGYKKDDLSLSLEYLQENTNTPVVFIDASFGKLPEAYRMLGAILNYEKRAEILATYIEGLYVDIYNRKSNITTPFKILYAGNENGMRGFPYYSYQNEVIKFIGGIPVELDANNNQLDVFNLNNIDIEYVVFNNWSCCSDIKNKKGPAYKIWGDMQVIKDAKYVAAPGIYHSWIGTPLLVQTIGMIWLSRIIRPYVYNYDLPKKIQEFYRLFYGYEMTIEELEILLGYRE